MMISDFIVLPLMHMRKILLFVFVLSSLIIGAQEKLSVVTLKNGTELTGVIKAIDPLDAMTIIIGGVETTIKMSDVAKVDERTNVETPSKALQLTKNSKLIVTDTKEYPDSFQIDVNGTKINMILVRGGDMNMGFEGDDSVDMNSEPVHPVSVTSFYISNKCITSKLAKELIDKKVDTGRLYYRGKWKDIEALIRQINQITGLPLRVPTEAEWEFAACSDKQNLIFEYNDDDEFCSDYFGSFDNFYNTIDPTGPDTGRRHVVRYYGKGDRKFDRDHSDPANRIRLVMKAKDYMQSN